MLLETAGIADDATSNSAENNGHSKRTVAELIDLLRVDDPYDHVTPAVRQRLAEELSWLLAPDDEHVRGVIVKYRGRTPEEVYEIRRRCSAKGRRARPLPPGMTLEDVVVGKWPGNETDEQVREAMEHAE